MQETEPLDIIIVRRGQRTTGEAYILLRMPIQVEMVLRKDKTYIGKRYVEVNLAKKLVRASVRGTACLHEFLLFYLACCLVATMAGLLKAILMTVTAS